MAEIPTAGQQYGHYSWPVAESSNCALQYACCYSHTAAGLWWRRFPRATSIEPSRKSSYCWPAVGIPAIILAMLSLGQTHRKPILWHKPTKAQTHISLLIWDQGLLCHTKTKTHSCWDRIWLWDNPYLRGHYPLLASPTIPVTTPSP